MLLIQMCSCRGELAYASLVRFVATFPNEDLRDVNHRLLMCAIPSQSCALVYRSRESRGETLDEGRLQEHGVCRAVSAVRVF